MSPGFIDDVTRRIPIYMNHKRSVKAAKRASRIISFL